MDNDNNTVSTVNSTGTSVEKRVTTALLWVFFLPIMLIFTAAKSVKFKCLFLALAVVVLNIYLFTAVHIFTICNEYVTYYRDFMARTKHQTVRVLLPEDSCTPAQSIPDVFGYPLGDSSIAIYDAGILKIINSNQAKIIGNAYEDSNVTDESGSDSKIDEIVYVTKSGKKYHTKDCYVLKDAGIAKSLDDAVSQGYEPCKKCHK